MGEFALDLAGIRDQARQEIEKGAVTDAYGADLPRVIAVANDALATELVCVLRYKRHYFTASGLAAEPIAAEFAQHAAEEQGHADRIAARIVQLGGEPDFNPATLVARAHSEYDASAGLRAMLTEDLVAERVAISTYSEIIRWLGEGDSTTRRLFEDILAQEEEHAEDLITLLRDPSIAPASRTQ